MLFAKLISLILVTAILNPICCCNADILIDVQADKNEHACCAGSVMDDEAPPQASCESEEGCPINSDWQRKQSQQGDVKAAHSNFSIELAFLWTNAELLSNPSRFEPALGKRSRRSTQESPPEQRLHQENCVYLL